jgi:hypothetical protein
MLTCHSNFLLDYIGEEDAQNARVMRIKNAAILHRQWPMPPERRVAGPSHFGDREDIPRHDAR